MSKLDIRYVEKEMNRFLAPQGYKIAKIERVILGWGPTITDDFDIVIRPMKSPPPLGVSVSESIDAGESLGDG